MKKHDKDLCKEKILQIGHGIVGKESASLLRGMGVDFDLYDKDDEALAGVEEHIVPSQDGIKQYGYILDFTNEGDWLSKADLADDVLYASPGVPYSMDQEAAECFEDRAIHDNLEIGTAIMLGQALKG